MSSVAKSPFNLYEKILYAHSLSNAVECLLLGELYKAEVLKETATVLIMDNMRSFSGDPNWRQLKDKDPNLAFELQERFISERAA